MKPRTTVMGLVSLIFGAVSFPYLASTPDADARGQRETGSQ